MQRREVDVHPKLQPLRQLVAGSYLTPPPKILGHPEQDDDDDVIFIGQGYRYTLRDQDAFCLGQCKAACSKMLTTGVGRYYNDEGDFKYGR